MDERVLQFRVGVVIVAAIFIAVTLMGLFGDFPAFFARYQTLYVGFPEAPGVTVDTPVRKSGILIGRVTDVKLVDTGVQVTTRIESKYMPSATEVCRISSKSLFGDAMIEFLPGNAHAVKKVPLSDGSYIQGMVTNDPMRVLVNLEGRMNDAMASIQGAGDEVSLLARNLNVVVDNNQDQLQRILNQTEISLGRFEVAMNSINDFVGDEELKGKLTQALNDVPTLITEARETMAGMREASDGIKEASSGIKDASLLAQTNLDNLTGFTTPLKERGPELVESFGSTLDRLDTLLAELTTFSRSLNDSEGTLGQLVHNPDLYQKLNRSAENIEEVTSRLRPIVDDVRIFTDKIARDPGGELGVRGALRRQQAGTKFTTPGGATGTGIMPWRPGSWTGGF